MKKELKFTFDLNCCFTVYVPSTINVNETVDNSQYIDKVMRKMAAMFGGSTSTDAVGCWLASNGEKVIEHITKVYSYCTSEQAIEKIDEVLELCEWLKSEMKQEAISLEYNGQLKFV